MLPNTDGSFRAQNAVYAAAKRDAHAHEYNISRAATFDALHLDLKLQEILYRAASRHPSSSYMAQRRRNPFFCENCRKDFLYKSKFARHLASSSHKRFTESLKLSLCTSSSLETCFEGKTEFQDGEQKEVI